MATTKIITEVTDLNAASSTNGLKMPTGGAYSGTPTDGMVRNSSETGSQGSANVMQHFNGTEWKNYENLASTFTTDFLVVAGGGGGGGFNNGGGGGAGGYRTTFGTVSPITLNGGSMETALTLSTGVSYNVSIGLGGAGGDGSSSPGLDGLDGQNSLFGPPSSEVIATGGGGGGANNNTANTGGYGGGGAYNGGSGAIAVTSPVIQGFSGGRLSGGSPTGPNYDAGGGGGAAEAGDSDGNAYGGDGLENQITGAAGIFYAGGGGGGTNASAARPGGEGGGGAGGRFNNASPTLPVSGTINTGGGGGGATYTTNTPTLNGAAGGSGIVILRYPTANVSSYAVTGTLDTTTDTAYPVANTAYYKLNGDALDSSGNGYNATTLGSISYTGGRFGQSASFTGVSNNRIQFPSGIDTILNTKNFGLSLWVKAPNAVTDSIFTTETTNSTFGISANWNIANAYSFQNGGGGATNLGAVDSDWHHIVITSDGSSSYKGYFDGVYKGAVAYRVSGSTSNTVLGGFPSGGFELVGQVDQVRIFNSQLNQTQITQLYNEGTVVESTDGTDSILQFIGGTGTVTFS